MMSITARVGKKILGSAVREPQFWKKPGEGTAKRDGGPRRGQRSRGHDFKIKNNQREENPLK